MGESDAKGHLSSRILSGLRARGASLSVAGLSLVVFVAGIVLLAPGSFAIHAWMDLGWTFFSALATIACVRTAIHVERPQRRKAWWAFALGAFGWTLGILEWSWLELVRGVVTPFPAIADIGFLMLPIGLSVGLFFYGGDSPGIRSAAKQVGDLGLVLGTIGFCSILVLEPAVMHEQEGFAYAACALAYPILHLSALFFTITTLWSRSWQKESARVVALLAVATLVLAFVTTFYAQSLLLKRYEAGHLLDPLWPVCFALVYVASAEERRRNGGVVGDERVRVTLGDVLVPPLCIAVAAIVGYSQRFQGDAASPLLFAFGIGLALSLAVRNVAQRKMEVALREELAARERQFITAQKMEAVATLAGGLAHDFNNLLTGVLGGVGMLRATEKAGGADPAAVDLIEQSAQRAADLTKRLLTFARRREAQRAPMSPYDVIRRAGMLVRSAAPDNVIVREVARVRSLTISADASQLEHALVNLGLNAVHAMPLGGNLTFELSVEGEGEGREVIFEVRDTGVGIPESARDHVFEPFYSTRAIGQGTGLGLAMVRAAALAHEGRVTFESTVGEGTRFRIAIPLIEASPAAAPASIPPASLLGGGETILVVDERGVALLAARATLESAGYRVLATSRMVDAVDLAERGEPIDAMLIDIMMPDADGFAVAEALRTRLPGVPIVLVTGNLPPSSLPPWASSVIEKPYRSKALLTAVRDVIEASRRSASGAA